MTHIKTTKQSIGDILKDIEQHMEANCPDSVNVKNEIEKAVNSIDLLISTIERQTRLEIRR